jgi:magnesium-transporting ATPase (P-type)
MKNRTSKSTWDVLLSTFGPFQVTNILMLLAILVLVIFRPNADDPGTFWAIAIVALLIVITGVIVVSRGGKRLKRLREAAQEDRRRVEARLPLERDDPNPSETHPDRGFG